MSDPIFLNGQFRTRSTWWFTKFREVDSLICFYAPLTPDLCDTSPKEVGTYSNEPSLRHERTEHYYREYPFFDTPVTTARDWVRHPYVLSPHAQDDDLKHHIESLIMHAKNLGKRPVFKINWGLFRGAWIKQNFGGTHIYLDRDYESICRSFDSMGILGWAWQIMGLIVGQNHTDPVISPLANRLGYHPEEMGYRNASRSAARFWNDYARTFGKQQHRIARVEATAFFQKLGLHHARTHYADHVLNDSDNINNGRKAIRELTGIELDVSTYKRTEPARRFPVNIDNTLESAIEALDHICSNHFADRVRA